MSFKKGDKCKRTSGGMVTFLNDGKKLSTGEFSYLVFDGGFKSYTTNEVNIKLERGEWQLVIQ